MVLSLLPAAISSGLISGHVTSRPEAQVTTLGVLVDSSVLLHPRSSLRQVLPAPLRGDLPESLHPAHPSPGQAACPPPLQLPCLFLLTSDLAHRSPATAHSLFGSSATPGESRLGSLSLERSPGLGSVDFLLVSSRLLRHVLRETEPPITHLRAFPITWFLVSLLSPSVMGEDRTSLPHPF